jgi:hypothetical protein
LSNALGRETALLWSGQGSRRAGDRHGGEERGALGAPTQVVVPPRYSASVEGDLKNGQIWWSTDRATVGLIVRDGIVVEAAPYARRWAQGREAREIYQKGERRKGVTVAWIPANED